jgi:hypothetical protein
VNIIVFKFYNFLIKRGLILLLNPFIFSQSLISSNSLELPLNKLFFDLNYKINEDKRELKVDSYYFSIEYKNQFSFNNGHSNIDNEAEYYSPGSFTNFSSTRFEIENQWLKLEVEPYAISHKEIFNNSPVYGTFQSANYHNVSYLIDKLKIGFRQSRIVLHYKGFGIAYGNMSHWWGPGFHSSLALSSNAESQKTYSIGTFKDINMGPFSFYSQVIVMPYESNSGTKLYFSGLKSHIKYHSKSSIITLGLHRTYLSGNFDNLSSITNNINTWSLKDALSLVIEPLFGESKRNLDYSRPGTPGFDAWDEVLTGYVKILFPEYNFEVYIDVASDDNRANLTDLKAHWDHTLAYQLGSKIFTKFNKFTLFTGIEFTTTRISNTFNPAFYRGGPNTPNFYTKPLYDYFTYNGRRMGAHSGSSSDDLIIMLGLGNHTFASFISYNKERHGIKSKRYTEVKTELSLSLRRKVFKHGSVFITLENEKIKNYAFIENNISKSKLIWLGYSFLIN